jgi:hypothetical protein
MLIKFELSMPNTNSWNGKWSGEGDLFARVVNFGRGKANDEKANEILDKKSFYYNFGDGWGASVSVSKIDTKEAAKVRKNTAGFCGYDWMISSIRDHGKITP